jgi:hypothetical protein
MTTLLLSPFLVRCNQKRKKENDVSCCRFFCYDATRKQKRNVTITFLSLPFLLCCNQKINKEGVGNCRYLLCYATTKKQK